MAQDVCLITGASSGIGEALARRIAREKRDVVLVARRADRLEQLAGSLRGEYGIEALVLPTDLTAVGACRALVHDLGRRGLAVDWLVNNAGFGTYGRFAKLPIDRELEEIRLNVLALVELTGLLLPGMVSRDQGAVVNVASVAGFSPGPYMATYCATKAFVKSFSEAIAHELADSGVRVLCVCPGFTRTEFQGTAHVDASVVPEFAWMSADEVADQAVQAVSQGGVLVTGMLNSVTASTMRLLPTSIAARVVGSLMSRGRGT